MIYDDNLLRVYDMIYDISSTATNAITRLQAGPAGRAANRSSCLPGQHFLSGSEVLSCAAINTAVSGDAELHTDKI